MAKQAPRSKKRVGGLKLSKFISGHRNPTIQLAEEIVGIPVISFGLLNLAFLVAGLIAGAVEVARLQPHPEDGQWTPWMALIITVAVIAAASWFVLRSRRFAVWFKAAFSTVPLATVSLIIGTRLWQWPMALAVAETMCGMGVLAWLLYRRAAWQYIYALVLIAAAMASVAIFNIEI